MTDFFHLKNMCYSFCQCGCFCLPEENQPHRCTIDRNRKLCIGFLVCSICFFLIAILYGTAYGIPHQAEIQSGNCTIIDCVMTPSTTYYYLQYQNITSNGQFYGNIEYCDGMENTICWFYPWEIANTLSDTSTSLVFEIFAPVGVFIIIGIAFLFLTTPFYDNRCKRLLQI